MIAALFVETDGVYFGLPDVDPWDATRDARLYPGPHPVVAHPPCERWGRYWHGGPSARVRRAKGDDGGCFKAALEAAERWGGVLEHPEASHAWGHFGLARPPHTGGWIQTRKGWTCCVEQGHYGHRARKKTWLYVVGPRGHCRGLNDTERSLPWLPTLKWGPSAGERLDEGFHSAEERRAARAAGVKPRRRLSTLENLRTPIPFRDALLGIARAVDIPNFKMYTVVPATSQGEDHMAARKPGIRSARKPRTPEVDPLDGDEVPHGFNLIAAHLVDIKNEIAKLVDVKLAEGAEPDTVTKTVLDDFLAKLKNHAEKIVTVSDGLTTVEKRLEKLEKEVLQPASGETVAAITEPAKRRGRRSNAEIAAAQAAACPHAGSLEVLARPGLARCTACNAVIDVPEGHEVQFGNTVKKAVAPAPAPVVQPAVAPAPAQPTNGAAKISADDVRAVAITFAGKHGKPKLAELFQRHGFASLTVMPPEKYAAVMAELQAGI